MRWGHEAMTAVLHYSAVSLSEAANVLPYENR